MTVTIFAYGFLGVRGNVPVVFGTLVHVRVRLDVLGKASFVDVSDSLRSYLWSGDTPS